MSTSRAARLGRHHGSGVFGPGRGSLGATAVSKRHRPRRKVAPRPEGITADAGAVPRNSAPLKPSSSSISALPETSRSAAAPSSSRPRVEPGLAPRLRRAHRESGRTATRPRALTRYGEGGGGRGKEEEKEEEGEEGGGTRPSARRLTVRPADAGARERPAAAAPLLRRTARAQEWQEGPADDPETTPGLRRPVGDFSGRRRRRRGSPARPPARTRVLTRGQRHHPRPDLGARVTRGRAPSVLVHPLGPPPQRPVARHLVALPVGYEVGRRLLPGAAATSAAAA